MSKFLRNITLALEYDGDSIEVVLKPLRTEDALRIKALGEEAREEETLRTFRDIVGPSVVSMKGLRTADGTELGFEEMAEAMYFAPLLIDIGNRWVIASNPRDP